MKFQKALTPDKPFFMYFAPGATHAPHHVPKEWIDKNKGRFDAGWDKMREETLARQIELGVVPQGHEARRQARGHQGLGQADRRREEALRPPDGGLCRLRGVRRPRDRPAVRCHRRDGPARQHADLLHPRRQRDERRGRHDRHVQRDDLLQRRRRRRSQEMLKHYDEWGGPTTYPHMAAGWAVAGDTPFMWTKQIPSNYGGTRNGMIVSWPKRIKAANQVRSQWHHVIDVAPTVLEAASLPEPKSVNGIVQAPIEGVSMVYTFDNANAHEHAQDPVLRDHRQSRHLPRRLVCRHHPPGAVGADAPRASCRRTSGNSTTRRNDFSLVERSGRARIRRSSRSCRTSS